MNNLVFRIFTALKMKFSIKDFFSNFDQIRSSTEKILNGKLHFLCSIYHLLSRHSAHSSCAFVNDFVLITY